MIRNFGASIPAAFKKAEDNEDYYLQKEYDDGTSLIAVADGTSDSDAGVVAAKVVVAMIHEVYEKTRFGGRELFEAFQKHLASWTLRENEPAIARCTLTIVKIQPEGAGARAYYFGIGDTAVLLAQDRRLGEEYPKTFVCYRIFSRPQPFVDARLFAYVDLARREVVGRTIFGEFELLSGDICLVYTDGVRDEYIQRTVNQEHKFLWDLKMRGPEPAITDFMKDIRDDVGDDATIVAIVASSEGTLESEGSWPTVSGNLQPAFCLEVLAGDEAPQLVAFPEKDLNSENSLPMESAEFSYTVEAGEAASRFNRADEISSKIGGIEKIDMPFVEDQTGGAEPEPKLNHAGQTASGGDLGKLSEMPIDGMDGRSLPVEASDGESAVPLTTVGQAANSGASEIVDETSGPREIGDLEEEICKTMSEKQPSKSHFRSRPTLLRRRLG